MHLPSLIIAAWSTMGRPSLLSVVMCLAMGAAVWGEDPPPVTVEWKTGPEELIIGGDPGLFDVTITNHTFNEALVTTTINACGSYTIGRPVFSVPAGGMVTERYTVWGMQPGTGTITAAGRSPGDGTGVSNVEFTGERSFKVNPRNVYFDHPPDPKYQQVDLHGVPKAGPSPTGEGESDWTPNQACIDMYNLDLRWSVTDLALPVEGGELVLEMRRTMRMESKLVPLMHASPTLDPLFPADHILGMSWSANLGGHVVIRTERLKIDNQDIDYQVATVTDEVGCQYRYWRNAQAATPQEEFVPDVLQNSNNEAMKARLEYVTMAEENTRPGRDLKGRYLVLTKTHGTRTYYTYGRQYFPPYRNGGHPLASTLAQDYYKPACVEDRLGNRIRYEYNTSDVIGEGSIEELRTLPMSLYFVHDGQAVRDNRRLSFVYKYIGSDPGYDPGYRLIRASCSDGATTRHVEYLYDTVSPDARRGTLVKIYQPAVPVWDPASKSVLTLRPEVNLTYQSLLVPGVMMDPTQPIDETSHHLWMLPTSIKDPDYTDAEPTRHITTFTYATLWKPAIYHPNCGGAWKQAPGVLGWKMGPRVETVTTMDGTAVFTTDLHQSPTLLPSFTTTATDTRGCATQYTFSQRVETLRNYTGYMIAVWKLARQGQIGGSVEYTWQTRYQTTSTAPFTGDPNRNLISVRDISGNTIQYSYRSGESGDAFDAWLKPTAAYDPYSNPNRYQLYGKPASRTMFDATRGRNIRTAYRYDKDRFNKECRVIQDADGLALTTLETLDDEGNRTAVTEAYGTALASMTRYGYDGSGRMTGTEDADGRVRSFVYFVDPPMTTSPITRKTYPQLVIQSVTSDYHGMGPAFHTYLFKDLWGNTCEMIDPRNGLTTYTYDAQNRLLSTTRPAVTVSGSADQVTSTSTTTYDRGGNPVILVDDEGHVTMRQYDGMNRLVGERRRMVSNSVDNAADLVTTTSYADSNGKSVGLVTATTDTNLQVTRYTHDALLRLTTRTLPLLTGMTTPATETYQYGANAGSGAFTIWSGWQPTVVKDRQGNVTTTTYDSLYRPTLVVRSVTAGDTTSAGAQSTSRSYNALHQVTREVVVTGRGNRTTLTFYDALMRPTAVVVDLNGNGNAGTGLTEGVLINDAGSTGLAWDAGDLRISRCTYDLAGHVKQSWDAEGGLTVNTYDSRGHLTLVEQPLVAVVDPDRYTAGGNLKPTVRYAYDAAGNRELVTDANGTVTRSSYDARNRLEKTAVDESGLNLVTRTVYNLVDKPVQVTDALGNLTQTVHDWAYRPLEIRQPMVADAEKGGTVAPTTRMTYDRNGNTVTITDARGVVTKNEYDQWNRVVRVTAAALDADATVKVVTEKAYDLNGNVTALTLRNGAEVQRTDYVYDSFNNKVRETLPKPNATDTSVRKTEWRYHQDGLLKTITDAKSQVTTHAYDLVGRLTSTTLGAAETRTCTYSGFGGKVGKATRVVDIAGTTDITYDAHYRVTAEKRTWREAGATVDSTATVTSSYNALGVRTQVVHPTTNRRLESLHDRAGRLTAVNDYENGATTTAKQTRYGYDRNGNRLTCATPNGLVTTCTYDALNRNVTAATRRGTSVIASYTYGYDAVGNRMTVVENLSVQGLRTITYTYDNQYRLKSEKWPLYSATYLYDAAGNRKRKTLTQGAVTTTDVTYDALNRAISSTAVTGTVSVTTTCAYDLNGNLITRTVGAGVPITYQWDIANRLVGVDTNHDGVNEFTAVYDHRTRRVAKTEGGVTTRYLYDQGDCCQEMRTGAIQVEFVRGPGQGGGIGSVLYSDRRRVANGIEETFAYNPAVGHVVALTNATGMVVETNRFEAFGGMVKATGTSKNNRLANTKERDASIGLDNHGFRYYDPVMGRYISRDPAGYADGLNVYLYVHNNPINFFDPLGLGPWDWVQGTLDVAAFVPFLSIPASGLNAVISLGRGDYAGAAMNAAGMIPGEKIAAAAFKGAKTVRAALTTEKAVVGTEKALIAGEKGAQLAEKAAVKVETETATKAAQGEQKAASSASNLTPPDGVTPLRPGENLGPHAPGDVPNNHSVVRGGSKEPGGGASPEGIRKKAESVDNAGNVHGVSVEAGAQAPADLAAALPQKQYGVTTAGEVCQAGGTVTPAPTSRSPTHAVVGDMPAKTFSDLLEPGKK